MATFCVLSITSIVTVITMVSRLEDEKDEKLEERRRAEEAGGCSGGATTIPILEFIFPIRPSGHPLAIIPLPPYNHNTYIYIYISQIKIQE